MSDNGDMSNMSDDSGNSAQDVGGETTVDCQENGHTETDSGYNTLTNSTPFTSTETLNNDNDASETMEIDEVASNSTLEANGSDVALNMGESLRCDKCKNPFDDNTRTAATGDCGHAQCSACWRQSNHLCSTCNLYSRSMQPDFPVTGRDMMSPEQIDEPMEINTVSKGVLLKTPTHSTNVGTASTVKSNQHGVAKNNGVLLKSPSDNSTRTASTLSGVKAKPTLPTTSATDMAQVKVKCMNGKTLDESINPRKTSVGDMKRSIHQKTGISYERQHLLHQGRTMTDSKPLHSYNVQTGSTIQMAERCSGG